MTNSLYRYSRPSRCSSPDYRRRWRACWRHLRLWCELSPPWQQQQHRLQGCSAHLSVNANARLVAFAPSLALDLTFGIHSHKTLDSAQPCHLLKPNWKPSSSHSIFIPTNISTQFLLQSLCVCVCVRACVRACVRVCVRACVHACMHVCMHVHACVHTCTYSSATCLCSCICVLICLLILIYWLCAFFHSGTRFAAYVAAVSS